MFLLLLCPFLCRKKGKANHLKSRQVLREKKKKSGKAGKFLCIFNFDSTCAVAFHMRPFFFT